MPEHDLIPDLSLLSHEAPWLELDDPRKTTGRTSPVAKESTSTHNRNLRNPSVVKPWHNISPIKGLILSFFVCLLFMVLYSLFIYNVLIRGNPQVGPVLFDASTSNLLVSIFSQVFAMLSDHMVRDLLDVLRIAFARNNRHGTSATTFFGISAATGWPSAFKLALASRFLNLWCDFRLAIPIMGLAFGSILKFQATFDYYFSPGTVKIPVYAGMVPMDTRLLTIITLGSASTAGDLWIYFESLIGTFLQQPKFSVAMDPENCPDSNSSGRGPLQCKSFLLPGGLELVRRALPTLDTSVFKNNTFNHTDVIGVKHSRGVLVSFTSLEESGVRFNPYKDCLYAGQSLPKPDLLQLCVLQDGDSITVGWAACPQALFDSNMCGKDNNSWITKEPIKWATKMAAFTQYTDVVYDRRNGSIIDTRTATGAGAGRETMHLDAAQYRTLWTRLLVPTNGSLPIQVMKTQSLVYDMTWVHRTYNIAFPEQTQEPLDYLQNFLAIPLQFGVLALEFANYTITKTDYAGLLGDFLGDGDLSLPDSMRTFATDGQSTSRLVIQEWTGWMFIVGAAALLIAIMVCILWVLLQSVSVHRSTGIPELDFLTVGVGNKTEADDRGGSDPSGDRRNASQLAEGSWTLTELAHERRALQDEMSWWEFTSQLRGWRVGREPEPTAADGNYANTLKAVRRDTLKRYW